ncbi:MAG: OsmC family protein [Chloroflexi bacterium]|nr:OsmC family protein [Chloroflexota bacterium]
MTISIKASVDPESGRVEATTPRGVAFTMDADAPDDDESPAPKEALLASLAGCTGMDVASILRKKRQAVATYEIAIEAESASEHPRVFTDIRVEHRVGGEVTAEALRRSIELSATRYCPVNAMLSARVTIEHRYQLVDAEGAEHTALVAVTGPDGARVL